jgi:phosphatidylserine decarboxylase
MNDPIASWLDKLRVLPQYLIPQHFITSLVYRITRCETPWFKNILIKLFISVFEVDMTLANNPDPESYSSFNTFFTRELSAEARPITLNINTILSPVDGTVSQVGGIENDIVIQAKGKSYSLKDLLVEDELVSIFSDGTFATLYLAPKDYHRIHMPISGQLTRMIYVPGRLFSVNSHTVRVVESVFARNERVINIFNTNIGPIAMVMVGALNVGSMETIWAGEITPAQNNDKNRIISDTQYSNQVIRLQQGQEMGRFNMGSTVILLFPKDTMQWSAEMKAEKVIVVGEEIAHIK